MNSDLVPRPRQAPEAVAPRKDQPAGRPLDPAKGAQLLARAQAAIEAPPKQTLLAAAPPPPPAPRAERVKLPMHCSARGVPYVVIAERRGDESRGYELRFVGHEMPQPGTGGTSRLPGRLSGQYRIEAKGWACPLCANTDAVWLCECERMNGAMHCHGTSGGRFHCACGRFEEREFVNVKTVEVRGASVAATPDAGRSGSPHGQPQLKQVSYERDR
jgi:hypothetical protein